MKSIYKSSLFITALLTVVLFTGCNKYLDVNTDPNRATDANMTADLIFPNAAVEVAALQANAYWSTTSNNFASNNLVFLNRWMGYWGWPGDYAVDQEETSYNINFSSSDGIWSRYYNTLFDLHQVQVKATAKGDSVLAGTSIILSAKLWQELVDVFGDIPYSQTFQSDLYQSPIYDKGTDVYAALQTNLDNAIVLVGKTAKKTFPTTDIVFNGDANKWKKFANTLKLRILLRQAETTYKSAAPTAELAKIAANGGILGSGEPVNVNPGFTNSAGKQSPFYAAYGKTATNADASSTTRANNFFVTLLANNSDPRNVYFFRTVGGNVVGTTYGLPQGNPLGSASSQAGPGVAKDPAQAAWILPAFESMFFHAEAVARGWMSDKIDSVAYRDAVKESFVWLMTPNLTATQATQAATDYLASADIARWSANAGSTVQSKVNFILTQKYISLCSVDALEAWSDYRKMNKTTIPATVTAGNGDSFTLLSVNPARGANTIPLRMLYPQSEYTANPNTPTTAARIFWIPQY
jgi:hypothetical protein